MEPFSALSVATAACQFLDFTAKLVAGTWKIYNSDPGRDTDRMSHLRTITEDTTRLNDDIRSSILQQAAQTITPTDAAILELGEKCNDLGRRLIDALNGLCKQVKPGRRQAWDSFRVALRVIWSSSELEALKQDLQNYRQQITMHLIVSQRDLIVDANCAQLQAVNAANTSQLQAINTNTDLCSQILHRLDVTDMNTNILAIIRQVYGAETPGIMVATSPSKVNKILETSDTSKVSQLILHKLHFKEIDHRYERVTLAYQETFEWLFLPPTKDAKWANYFDWLENGEESLYWITGKAGAGKSTLMRFVFDHPQTRHLLQSWSQERRLLTASFFFWNSGITMQMSCEGMVRSLLFQILKQAPELIPVAFPYRVFDGILFGTHIFGQETWSWSWEELMKAFRILLRQATKTYKIAVFIDGMDEFQGKPIELIDFVKTLQMPDVKICASSRPWNQFQDAFGHGPHLRVERLTFGDIERVVISRLSRSPAFSHYKRSDPEFSAGLIKDVCEKSEGMFLWVHLVSNSLLEGLSDGERPVDLHKRLDSLPTDLEELFEKILGGLDTRHAERSSQLFQIHRASSVPLTLLDMSFADEDNLLFAINAQRKVLTPQETNARVALMKRRINACTKGLLEADTHNVQEPAHIKVNFLHRTVRDYLERPDIWQKMCAAAPASFSCHFRLCNCFIMRLKREDQPPDQDSWFGYCIEDITHGTEHAIRGTTNNTALRNNLMASLDEIYTDLTNALSLETSLSMYEAIRDEINSGYGITEIAIRCEMSRYLVQGFQSLPKSLQSQIKSLSLLMITRYKNERGKLKSRPNLKTKASQKLVHSLLENGADPNLKAIGSGVSAWDRVLERATDLNDEHNKAETCAILEDFVLHGADLENKALARYLEQTTNDTTRLRKLIRQKKKKEKYWARKRNRFLSRFSSRHFLSRFNSR